MKLRECRYLALLLILNFQQVEADDWLSVGEGLCYQQIASKLHSDINVVVANTSNPHVAIKFTAHNERWQKTTDFARDNDLFAAINGGPWSLLSQKALGLVASEGDIWSGQDDYHGALIELKNGQLLIKDSQSVSTVPEDTIRAALSGQPVIVAGGVVPPELNKYNVRDARSVVGVSEGGEKVFFVVADGRTERSPGLTLSEIANLLVQLGAHDAINLDGGRSALLYLKTKGGLITRPARGFEREVVSHIGIKTVRAPTGSQQCDSMPNLAAGPVFMDAGATTSRGMRGLLSYFGFLDWLFVGKAREWLVPGAIVMTVFLFLAFLVRVFKIFL